MLVYKLVRNGEWWNTKIYRSKSTAVAAYNEAFNEDYAYKMLSFEVPDDPSGWTDTGW